MGRRETDEAWFRKIQVNKNGRASIIFPKEVAKILGMENHQELWIPKDRFTHRDDGDGEKVVGIILEKPPPDVKRPVPKQVRNHHGQKQCPRRHWNPMDARFCVKCGKQLEDAKNE